MMKPLAIISLIISLLLVAFPLTAQDESTVLFPGTYQAEDARITLPVEATIIDIDGAEFGKAVQFGKTVQTGSAIFTARGTDIIVRWKNPYLAGNVVGENVLIQLPMDTLWMRDNFRVITFFTRENENLVVDSNVLSRTGDNGWIDTIIVHSTFPQDLHIDLSEAHAGPKITSEDGIVPHDPYPLQIDSITVLDRSFQNIFPYAAAILITLGMTLFVVISALRERWQQ